MKAHLMVDASRLVHSCNLHSPRAEEHYWEPAQDTGDEFLEEDELGGRVAGHSIRRHLLLYIIITLRFRLVTREWERMLKV